MRRLVVKWGFGVLCRLEKAVPSDGSSRLRPPSPSTRLSFGVLPCHRRMRATDKEKRVCLSVILADSYQHSFLFELCCCRILSLVYEDARAMPGKRAKILAPADVGDLLVFASCTRHPLRNTVMVLLSAKAGLRAGEIANLTWDMVVDANSQISGLIELADAAAKKCSGRSIPVHPDLAAALGAWRQVAPTSDCVIASERGGRMRPLSIVVWFNRAFKNIGLKGCSSHSGRRTFVTRAARIVHKAGGSLRDVQLLAGHRSIQTTQRYIDGDSDAQRKLVAMI
jgi:integrase